MIRTGGSSAERLKDPRTMTPGRNWEQKLSTNRINHPERQAKLQSICTRQTLRGLTLTFVCFSCITALMNTRATAQAPSTSTLPFGVSNPKHLPWSTDEANRIYMSACELVARTVRPEKPPKLAPKFLLVLGTSDNETLRSGPTAEVHLKEWNPARFAEAMVLMATREILKSEDVMSLTRDTLMAAGASVSVTDLKGRK
jgi:hypothetical protein